MERDSCGVELAARPRARRSTILRRALRNRDIRLVEIGFLAFNTAEWATWIAILVFAYEVGGSVAAGLAAVIQLVPAALFAPFGSALSDLYPRERTILFSYLAQSLAMAATAAALIFGAPLALIYALAAVTASTITLTRPLQGALLPMLAATPEELIAANVTVSTIESVSIFLGPAVTGLLLAFLAPGSVFGVMAVAELVGALAVLSISFRDTQAAERRSIRTGLRASLIGGFSVVFRDRDSRLLLTVVGTHFIEVGALDVLFVVLALGVLHIGRPGAGFLNSAFGAGGVIGSGLGILLIGRRRLAPSLLAGAVVFGLALAVTGETSTAALVVLLLIVCGAGRALVDLTGRSLLQRIVPHESLARAFGALEGLAMAGLAVGAIVVPLLVTSFGARVSLFCIGGLLPVVALLGWRGLKRVDRAATVPARPLRLLQSLALFSGLEVTALERLALSLTPIQVDAGSVIFRQGDLGDRFYVIDEGEVDVVIDGEVVRRQAAGDFFGEISLLRRVPRTATVAAATDVRLYALEGVEFIEAVTGHSEVRQSADQIVEERLRRLN
ncbi:MAG: hypothetical protein QOG21_1524 [Actinomycetota bacterium]|nr:hypothetical protein [Actinomycetota bacterium]